MGARSVAVVLGLWTVQALAQLPGQEVAVRKTTPAQLALSVDRWVTSNGLTVVMSPDPSVHQVVVDLNFAAGTVYEPPGKSGLAHLVEHVMSGGATGTFDYQALLESRGVTYDNAMTTIDRLSFRMVAPPESLPVVLWVSADRLGSWPQAVDDAELERHRRIVLQERLHRVDDMAYGKTNEAALARLFPTGHPLHRGLLGTPATLATLTVNDVRAFTGQYLVPRNAVLTLTGNFDAQVARDWVERTLGRLPPGVSARPPPATPRVHDSFTVKVTERFSRRPRVTLAWTFFQPIEEVTEALSFGALLLSIYTNGLVGMEVGADLLDFRDGAVFLLAVTMPHAVDMAEAAGNAEVVFRFLAQAMMPADLMAATFHLMDRGALATLASPSRLATLLSRMEYQPPPKVFGFGPLEQHWRFTPVQIQQVAAAALRGPRLSVQSRPTRPLPPRIK